MKKTQAAAEVLNAAGIESSVLKHVPPKRKPAGAPKPKPGPPRRRTTGKGRDLFGESQGPSCSKASYQFGKPRFEPMEGDQTVADKLCKQLVTKEMKGQRTEHQFKSIVSSKAKGELKKGIYVRTLHKAGGSLCYDAAKQQYDHL